MSGPPFWENPLTTPTPAQRPAPQQPAPQDGASAPVMGLDHPLYIGDVREILARDPLAAWSAISNGKLVRKRLNDLQPVLASRHPWAGKPIKVRIEERNKIVEQESTRAGIPKQLAMAITRVENWGAQPWAVGGAGEIGLFQVNPRVHTPESVKRTAGGTDLSDPVVNTRFGIALLKNLTSKYDKWSDVIRAYNGQLDHPETELYLQLVAGKLLSDDDGGFLKPVSREQAANIIDSTLGPVKGGK